MTVSVTYPNPLTAAAASKASASSTATGTSSTSSVTNTGTSSTSGVSATNTLAQLAGNFTDFLSLLTTQLQNQDPTSPMDTNQFTSELVQFTSVSEQINTNQTLGQMLTASVAQELSQASGLTGQQVTFTGGTLPLQNGAATVDYQTPGAEPVQIAVSNSSGTVINTATVNATAGSNTWTWNGKDSSGNQLPDGAYTVAVTNAGAAVPFQAVGTVTGAQQANQTVQLLFGSTAVNYSQIASLSPTSN